MVETVGKLGSDFQSGLRLPVVARIIYNRVISIKLIFHLNRKYLTIKNEKHHTNLIGK
jgi:hypothetical protein